MVDLRSVMAQFLTVSVKKIHLAVGKADSISGSTRRNLACHIKDLRHQQTGQCRTLQNLAITNLRRFSPVSSSVAQPKPKYPVHWRMRTARRS
jgi:hypothetical protein